jgi:hypothetical protein
MFRAPETVVLVGRGALCGHLRSFASALRWTFERRLRSAKRTLSLADKAWGGLEKNHSTRAPLCSMILGEYICGVQCADN